MAAFIDRSRHIARVAVDFVDRTLHPLRRARTLALLRRLSPATDILFVCHGNICRSPYAEASFRALLADDESAGFRIRSAGFLGPGQPSPTEAVNAARRRGIDLSRHCSSSLSLTLVRESELIAVMDASQARDVGRIFGRIGGHVIVLGDLDPKPIRRRAIRDPFGEAEAVFAEVFGRLDRCLRSLHVHLRQRVPLRGQDSGGPALPPRATPGQRSAPRALSS